jgi:hypothetical protein
MPGCVMSALRSTDAALSRIEIVESGPARTATVGCARSKMFKHPGADSTAMTCGWTDSLVDPRNGTADSERNWAEPSVSSQRQHRVTGERAGHTERRVSSVSGATAKPLRADPANSNMTVRTVFSAASCLKTWSEAFSSSVAGSNLTSKRDRQRCRRVEVWCKSVWEAVGGARRNSAAHVDMIGLGSSSVASHSATCFARRPRNAEKPARDQCSSTRHIPTHFERLLPRYPRRGRGRSGIGKARPVRPFVCRV